MINNPNIKIHSKNNLKDISIIELDLIYLGIKIYTMVSTRVKKKMKSNWECKTINMMISYMMIDKYSFKMTNTTMMMTMTMTTTTMKMTITDGQNSFYF